MDKVTLFFHVPEREIVQLLKKGIWPRTNEGEKNLPIIRKESVIAFMSPKDKPLYDKSEEYHCVSFEVNPKVCMVGDMDLANTIMNYEINDEVDQEIVERWSRIYENSLMPLDQYRFGTFRAPEILVSRCISPEELEILGEKPVNLFGDHYDIYLKNTFYSLEENLSNGMELFLYLFFDYLSQRGILSKVSHKKEGDKNLTIYLQSETQRFFTIFEPNIKEQALLDIVSQINRLPEVVEKEEEGENLDHEEQIDTDF